MFNRDVTVRVLRNSGNRWHAWALDDGIIMQPTVTGGHMSRLDALVEVGKLLDIIEVGHVSN